LPDVENAIANATIVPAFTEIGLIAQAEKETGDANALTKAILSQAITGNADTAFVEQTCITAFFDGTYRAEFDGFDSHGWKGFLQFDMNDDDISNVDFDEIDADGLRKSEDQEYNETMISHVETNPELFMPQIESQVAEATICAGYDHYQVDIVTGATYSSTIASLLFEKVMLLAVKAGNTETVFVAQEN
jgi:major membrane immunogen (membrane-anchored lipoprotein)